MTVAVTYGEAPALNLAGRIPELDGLRGIAIGMVLIAHFFEVVATPGSALAYALVPLRLTWSGVDLFFVLSGFLIGGILLDARASSNYFRVFYTRRFFRIVPIYALLLVSVGFTMYLSDAGVIGKYPEVFPGRLPWAYFVLFLQNIGMSIHNVWGTFPLGRHVVARRRRTVLPDSSAPDPLSGPPRSSPFYPVRHYWRASASYLLLLSPPRGFLYLVHAYAQPRGLSASRRSWRHHPSRAALERLASQPAGACPRKYWGLVAGRGVPRLAGAFPPRRADGHRWFHLAALTYLAFLLYALLFRDSWISHCLRWSWLRGLGIIAYGTYLFHEFFLGMFFGRVPWLHSWRDVGRSAIVLVVTIVFCRLSWVYFEKPLVKLGHRSSYEFAALGLAKTAPAPAPGR